MTIMSKRGQLDNVVTYEHICDYPEDLDTIDKKYATIGSVAIVIHGNAGLEAYMADSEGTWVSLADGSSN